MVRLVPVPFPILLTRMVAQARDVGSVYDLPETRWFLPDPQHDLSASHFGQRGGTPLGPAAGPHTQLAHNLALSWLAGGRFLELKTVQANDRVSIPRPSIRVPNVGLNVEWSQELTLAESLVEYAKAAFLIGVLEETRAFGRLAPGAVTGTVFEASVGYDLAGLRSEGVSAFLQGLRDPRPLYDELRSQVGSDLGVFRDLPLPSPLARSVTLSTFHGCPPAEIEGMARHLMDLGFGVVVKLNPTLLGLARVRELVQDVLGYAHLEPLPEAFEGDLTYEGALALTTRLAAAARERGVGLGLKLTNTLVVRNDPRMFPTQDGPGMYLSGAPLHVLAMELVARFLDDLDAPVPLSFSAGVTAENVAETVSLGLVPVTSCTDLLKPRGYARLADQARALQQALRVRGVVSREAFVLSARGNGSAAAAEALRGLPGGERAWGASRVLLESAAPSELPSALHRTALRAGLPADEVMARALRAASRLNARVLVPTLYRDPRYQSARNSRVPRKREQTLGSYDCLDCDLCRTTCPNVALFSYDAEPVDVPTVRLTGAVGPDEPESSPGQGFRLRKRQQTALLADLCNACGSCGLFCPEIGDPAEVKDRFFLSRELFDGSLEDGFHVSGGALLARVGGTPWRLEVFSSGSRVRLLGDRVELVFVPASEPRGALLLEPSQVVGPGLVVDTALAQRLFMLWRGVVSGPRHGFVGGFGPAAAGPSPVEVAVESGGAA